MFFIENPSSFHIFFLFCPKIFGFFCPIEHSCFFRTAPFFSIQIDATAQAEKFFATKTPRIGVHNTENHLVLFIDFPSQMRVSASFRCPLTSLSSWKCTFKAEELGKRLKKMSLLMNRRIDATSFTVETAL